MSITAMAQVRTGADGGPACTTPRSHPRDKMPRNRVARTVDCAERPILTLGRQPLKRAILHAQLGDTLGKYATATPQTPMKAGVPRGNRTPVFAVRGRCPGPLDDGDGAADSYRNPACEVNRRAARFTKRLHLPGQTGSPRTSRPLDGSRSPPHETGNRSRPRPRLDVGRRQGVFFQLSAGPVAGESEARALCAELKRRRLYCAPVAL